jgi:iron complex outermembrane receptor protein
MNRSTHLLALLAGTGCNLANKFYFTSLTAIGAALKAGSYAGTTLLEGAQNPPRTIFL